jgi:hypothetical protein
MHITLPQKMYLFLLNLLIFNLLVSYYLISYKRIEDSSIIKELLSVQGRAAMGGAVSLLLSTKNLPALTEVSLYYVVNRFEAVTNFADTN